MRTSIKPEFHLPTEIYIRQDIRNNIADIAKNYGSRVILVTTIPDFDIYHKSIEQIKSKLSNENIGCIIYDELPSSPTTEDIDAAVSFTQKTNCDLIIGFGGAESLNSAKAISLLTKNFIFCNDLFSKSAKLNSAPLPMITIPAYPVFGMEITPIFYLLEIRNLTKKVFFNQSLYPRATVVDPVLSLSIPEEIAMKSCISTLAMATESIISRQNNDIINTYALKAIDLIFRNLSVSYSESGNISPRIALSTASLMSGIAFSTSFLSVTLSIALAISSKSELNVNDAMSILLPHIMDFNLTSSPGKYVQMAKVMGENVKDITVIEAAIKSVEAIRKLESDVDIPMRLSNYNISKTVFKETSELAMTYPFLANAPRELNSNEIETILIASY